MPAFGMFIRLSRESQTHCPRIQNSCRAAFSHEPPCHPAQGGAFVIQYEATMNNRLTFSEAEIQNLFGHEAAEDETPARLRQYYFKNDIYDRVTADLPLRILVGHKGVGKSALFKV